MNIAAIAFTDRGQAWSDKLGFPVARGIPVRRWTEEQFHKQDALLFIGACGIAVRAIAPWVKHKTTDPAVLVMDEAGQYIIPILSGHIGGANELACMIAQKIGATPVITTATDINGVPAIDVWAKQNHCVIENPEAIAPVSSSVLAGREVGVMITDRTIQPPFPVTLTLRPRTLTLGAGCKKGTDPAFFEACVEQFLRENGVSLLSIRALATIDVKQNEEAFLYFTKKYHLPLICMRAEELRAVPGTFAHSDFVEKTVGVGCVCERAAVGALGGQLVVGKRALNGVTLALAREEEL